MHSLTETDENMRRSNRQMRNTDSFFKDDSVEPKKISLTPGILRDESDTQTTNTPEVSLKLFSSYLTNACN